ncbi:MAG: hypothetical protein Tsb009_34780 [Planctomycetaceae bacterium]
MTRQQTPIPFLLPESIPTPKARQFLSQNRQARYRNPNSRFPKNQNLNQFKLAMHSLRKHHLLFPAGAMAK